MSYDKGERAGLGRLIKEIALWDGEQLQSIQLDADAFKGISEKVSKALDVSLNHIDTYRSGWLRTILLGQTTDSGGGGVT